MLGSDGLLLASSEERGAEQSHSDPQVHTSLLITGKSNKFARNPVQHPSLRIFRTSQRKGPSNLI